MLRRIYGDNFTLLIAGTLRPKTYREYVENMVRGLKLEGNVKVLGYVEQRLLPLLYNAADITIVPSYSEGAPLVIPESLACGTPVIATNVGGNPEYLEIVHLDPLLVRIHDYDFSVTLANKMFIALQEKWNVNINFVPSWNSTSQIYINILKELLKLCA